MQIEQVESMPGVGGKEGEGKGGGGILNSMQIDKEVKVSQVKGDPGCWLSSAHIPTFVSTLGLTKTNSALA